MDYYIQLNRLFEQNTSAFPSYSAKILSLYAKKTSIFSHSLISPFLYSYYQIFTIFFIQNGEFLIDSPTARCFVYFSFLVVLSLHFSLLQFTANAEIKSNFNYYCLSEIIYRALFVPKVSLFNVLFYCFPLVSFFDFLILLCCFPVKCNNLKWKRNCLSNSRGK